MAMRFGLILGDQLHHQLATLKALDRIRDVILMAEVVEEATYVAHHPQKIALILIKKIQIIMVVIQVAHA